MCVKFLFEYHLRKKKRYQRELLSGDSCDETFSRQKCGLKLNEKSLNLFIFELLRCCLDFEGQTWSNIFVDNFSFFFFLLGKSC